MKYTGMLVPVLLLYAFSATSQGTTCATAIPLIMDGVIRSYSTSNSTGANVVCPGSTVSPVTFFSFTTNAAAECPLLTITAPGGACEVAMYTACNGGNVLQENSSMCLDDGEGLWAPAHDYVLRANTQYIIRIRTASAGNISIGAQHFKPLNDDCFGATPIGKNTISDNNACHKGGPGVTADQLCAFSLENTAFYVFTVEQTGSSTIHISNIACDNGHMGNSNGFQIGFFTGSCNNLQALNCSSGEGAAVLASTYSLPAGTRVYVAIDGNSGSNCKYTIGTTNAQALATGVKDFSAWKTERGNLLKWSLRQRSEYESIEVQRSADGSNYSTMANYGSNMISNYLSDSYEDLKPFIHTWYRLKFKDKNGNISYSTVAVVHRDNEPRFYVTHTNPFTDVLKLNIETSEKSSFELVVFDANGNRRYYEKISCQKGVNVIHRNLSQLADGYYVLQIRNDKWRYSGLVIKLANQILLK